MILILTICFLAMWWGEKGTLVFCIISVMHSCEIQHKRFLNSPSVHIIGNDAIGRLGRAFACDRHFG
jgi:hypothetical protein